MKDKITELHIEHLAAITVSIEDAKDDLSKALDLLSGDLRAVSPISQCDLVLIQQRVDSINAIHLRYISRHHEYKTVQLAGKYGRGRAKKTSKKL